MNGPTGRAREIIFEEVELDEVCPPKKKIDLDRLLADLLFERWLRERAGKKANGQKILEKS